MQLTETQLRDMIREIIRKFSDNQYRVYSKKKGKNGKRRNLGTFSSRKSAEDREKDIQFFKHAKKE